MNRPSNKLLAFLLSLVLLLGVAGAPAFADGDYLVGEVTITATSSVNVRSGGSTDYPIIYKASPGELFQTTGQTTTGWYEILLPDGGFGYVSNGLVYFYAYAVPVPIGAQYTVPVYYRNLQGQTLKTVNAPVRPGQNIITADDSQVPGYRLTSTRSIYVYVDAAGRAVPNGVIFTYEPLYGQTPVTGVTLPIYYKDIYNQLIASEYRALNPGAQLVRADATKLPQGYYISGASDAVVIVSNYGTAAPSELTFTVTRISSQTPVPATFSVPVSYRNELGQVLLNTSANVQPGYTTVSANDSLVPSGYSLVSERSVVVYASSQGITFPSTVVFTYREAVKATIQIVYQDPAGRLLHTETVQYAPGTHTVTAYNTKVPSGYLLQGSRTQQVTVYANGTVSQNRVVFTYALPVEVNFPIEYRDNAGRVLYSETRKLNEGTVTITADDSKVPRGYLLQNTRSVQVTVYANGYAQPDRAIFIYAMPVSASVTIRYRDTSGGVLYTETRTYQQGSYTVTASDERVPTGYTLISNRSVNLTVNSNGTANPSVIEFTYAPPGPPITVNVPVYYKDQYGTILHAATVSVSSTQPTQVRAYSTYVPAGYTLTSPSPVTVTVASPSGIANPSQVEFIYKGPPAPTTPPGPPITVNVPVYYKDQHGTILHSASVSVSSTQPTEVRAYSTYVPSGYVLTSASPVTVTVASPSGIATPSQVVFTYRDPGSASGPIDLPNYQEFSYSGSSLPVYSGPGTNYYRAAGGKALLGGGRVRVWGTVGDWALIGYGLSNNLYRVGYITKKAIPADLNVPELYLGTQTGKIVSKAFLTDDPIVNPIWLTEIPVGTEVTILAYVKLGHPEGWAYIETTLNGKPTRGFINRIRVR